MQLLTSPRACVCVCVCAGTFAYDRGATRHVPSGHEHWRHLYPRCTSYFFFFFFFFLHLTVLTRCPPTQSDYFKMYNMYCSNHPYAVNKMETIKSKAFLKFINVHDHSVCSHVVSPFCATGATQQARVPQPRLGIVLDQTCPAYLQVPSSVARMLNCRLQLEK